MLTTSLFRLQENNPSTFAVMMNRRQRGKVVRYLDDLESIGVVESNKSYDKLKFKLANGYMSYDNNELSIMRAAINLNRFVEPVSFLCKRYVVATIK